jgi:excisionase family DNA binding protein
MAIEDNRALRGAMSIDDFAVWAGIGRTLVYNEIKAERLRIHKVGRRTLISYADAEFWLSERAIKSSPEPNIRLITPL